MLKGNHLQLLILLLYLFFSAYYQELSEPNCSYTLSYLSTLRTSTINCPWCRSSCLLMHWTLCNVCTYFVNHYKAVRRAVGWSRGGGTKKPGGNGKRQASKRAVYRQSEEWTCAVCVFAVVPWRVFVFGLGHTIVDYNNRFSFTFNCNYIDCIGDNLLYYYYY